MRGAALAWLQHGHEVRQGRYACAVGWSRWLCGRRDRRGHSLRRVCVRKGWHRSRVASLHRGRWRRTVVRRLPRPMRA